MREGGRVCLCCSTAQRWCKFLISCLLGVMPNRLHSSTVAAGDKLL